MKLPPPLGAPGLDVKQIDDHECSVLWNQCGTIDLCSQCRQVGYCRPLNKVQLRRMPHEERERQRKAESALLDAALEGGGGAQEGLQAKEEKAAAEAKEEEEEEEDEKARSGDNGAAGGSGRYCKKMKKGKKTRGKGRGR